MSARGQGYGDAESVQDLFGQHSLTSVNHFGAKLEGPGIVVCGWIHANYLSTGSGEHNR